ncbi:TPA: hypothetical protein ACH3X1_005366 [Trebouxia sp. C0004]
MYDEGLWVDLLRASRALRQYAEQQADQRQASTNLKLVVGTIFSPLLQELYLQYEAHAIVAEILCTLVALGRDQPEIICLMADEGIFYVLSIMALYPPTSEVTLASLGKLANCEGQAGWEAQVAIMSGATAQYHAPPPLLAPESSAMAAEADYDLSSCLPVVYKMLTAEDKGAQQAAVKMLSCLCQVDAEWQQQEQLAIATFGDGAILLRLVERIQSTCHQRKLSVTRASELSSVLNLVSLTTGGCQAAQSKVGSAGLLDSLVALLTPPNQELKPSLIAVGSSAIKAHIHQGLNLPALQVTDMLIAITNIAGQHPLNQARLASLAEPLTEALASVLQALPPLALAATAVVTSSQTDHPHQQQDEQQHSDGHKPSRQVSITDESKTEGNVPIEVHPQAVCVPPELTVSESQPSGGLHSHCSYAAAATPAGSGSHQAGITAAVSALSAQLKPTRPASALTAQLQSPGSAEATPSGINAHPAASGGAPSLPILSSHTPQISLGGAAAELSRSESLLGLELPQLPESSRQLEPSQTPESSQQPTASQGHEPSHAHGSSQEESMQHQEEVRLVRHFAFHVLMLLPAEVVKKRAGFWLQHADGVPDLLHCCVRVATLQDPQAIQTLQAATELWREKPDKSAEEAMQGLSHFPAVMQALVQAVHSSAASEAVQILSTLSQHGGVLAAVLGSAGAAEAIVRATLINEDVGHFESHKELTDLVVRVLPHPDSAVQTIQMCKTAILESSSSFIRHRALSIMRAVTAWLKAADAAAHAAGLELPEAANATACAKGKHDHTLPEAANLAAYTVAKREHESQHANQPHDSDTVQTLTTASEAVAAAASTGPKRGAEAATSVTPTGSCAGLARGFLNPRGPQSSQSAVPVGLSECQQLPPQSQQEYQQVVAATTQSLLHKDHNQEQLQQQQKQQQQLLLPALTAEEPAAGVAALEGMHPNPDASTPPMSTASSVLDDDAAGEGAEAAESAAAAASGDMSEADEADAHAADADTEQLAVAERQRTVDEAVERLFEAPADMLPLAQAANSGGSKSETDRSQQGRSGDSGSEQPAHSSHSRNAADSASGSASGAAGASAATSGEETKMQEEEGEGEADRELAGMLNTLGLQGLQAAVQSVLLPPQASSITKGKPSAAGKDKMVQTVPEQITKQIAAPGSRSDTSRPDTAFGLPQGAQSARTETRGEAQELLGAGHSAPASVPGQARGVPPLLPARVHSTAQQGVAAAVENSFRSTTAQQRLLSQDQMQMLVNQMFNIGYETMGQLSSGSIPTPAPAAASPTGAASGSNAVPAAGSDSGTAAGSAAPAPAAEGAGAAVVDSTGRSHDALQNAFNRLVASSLQRQAQATSQSAAVIPSSEAAVANRVAAVQLPPPMVLAPAPPANARLQRDQDHLPRRLVAREAERRRRELEQGHLPRHHSVFSSRNNDHVNAVTEQRVCPRQVGFGIQMRQRHAWVKHVVKGLFGLAAVCLAAGFASGKIQNYRASTASKKGNLSDADPAEEYDTDSDDF